MKDLLAQFESMVNISQESISPDGVRVVYAQSLHRKNALWIETIATKAMTRLTAGDGKAESMESDPAFSPDGSQIAFISDAKSKGNRSLYVANADGTNVKAVAKLPGAVQQLKWAPDGTQLAFLYIAHPHRQSGAVSAGARAVGLIGTVNDEQGIATVAIAGGSPQLVTPAEDYVYEYGWSPDSKAFAFTYARGNGDNNWWIAKLATIPSAGGTLTDVLSPSYQINAPTWSPDGKSIAVIGGLMSDFGSVGGDIYVVDVASRAAKDLTPTADFSATSLHWNVDGHIDATAVRNGAMHLVRVNTADGGATALIGGEDVFRSVSIAKDGTLALVRSSFTAPPELYVGKPDALVQLTNVNANAPKFYDKAVSLTWTNEGLTSQGWLIYPLNYDPAKKYPMVTMIHGGPSAATLPGFGNAAIGSLTANGYFVFEPNPRGSYGEGEAFTQANRKDFGYGDWHDDLAGIDMAIKSASIDGDRLGLMGWSYGGYISMWAETQTTRFKAIVAGAGVSNWESYYGENNINQWMVPFFGASIYDDPAVYAKSSPMTFIKQSKTPVLILASELDEEVPAPQSFEFYNALQSFGVPSQLYIYADEGHAVRQPAHQVDRLERTFDWFEKYLQ